MIRTYDLNPSDEALYQRSNEYLSRLKALDPYSGEYSDVYNDYLDTIDQLSNKDFKASLSPTVAKFAPLVRPQVQKVQAQPQTLSRTAELNKAQDILNNSSQSKQLSPLDFFSVGMSTYPYSGFSALNSLNVLQQLPQQQQKEAVTPVVPSFASSTPEEREALTNLYNQYRSKAFDYNNVRLSDLNADARAITANIRQDISDIRNYLAGQTDNNFTSALGNTIPEALMATFSYLRDVDASGQYMAGNTTTAKSGETAKWDSLINSPREEQLKAYFDSYGGTRGFGVDEGEDSAELSIIRHDYEDFTQRLLPSLRKAFNISNDAQARNIAGYIALQLLHKGTERNSAFDGYLQDPYDYQHEAAEAAYNKLEEALKDPNVLHALDMIARANTALNKFETANQAYNNAVTTRNNYEATLSSLYGNQRSILQETVGNDMIKNIGTSIRARGGLLDSLESFDRLQKSQE